MALLLIALTEPAYAQQSGTETAAPAKPAKKPRMICKQDAELGTKISKTICMTWPEWQAREKAANDEAQRFLDHASEQAGAAGAAAAGAPR